MKGIDRLRERGIPFSVIAVVSQESIHEPERLLDFLAGLGCDTIGLNIEEIEGVNTGASRRHASTPPTSGVAPSPGAEPYGWTAGA